MTISSQTQIASPSQVRVSTWTKIVLSALFIALCAMIRIPLPFTPVPITLQTFAVMLIGGALGSRQGVWSVLCYLAMSVVGLPVLSGGQSNPFALMSPLAGYLVGFVVLAYASGWFVERKEKFGNTVVFLGILIASFVQMFMGAFVLGFFVGHTNAIYMGVIPFLLGDFVKVSVVTAIVTNNAFRK